MAIYHLSAQVISRSKGQSAVASAAYRSGERLIDERTGETKFYKREVQPETMIVAPASSPEWVQDRQQLWNEVEKSETRKNSQVAREINIALPRELSDSEQTKLIRGYVQKEFVDQGMIADVAIHRDDKENPHAHVMLTTREISKEGFTVKNRDWNKKEWLMEWREQWANQANQALERQGIQERITHESHQTRNLIIFPTVHLGHVAHEMEHRGIQTNRGNINRDVQEYNGLVVNLQKYREEKQAWEQEKTRQQIGLEGEVFQKAEKALENAVVRQVASHYPERPEMRYMSFKTAKALQEFNEQQREIVPIEKIQQIVNIGRTEIKALQGKIHQVEQDKARLQRVEGYMKKYEKHQSIVEQMENTPFLKGKMLVSKSAKQAYHHAVSARDQYKDLMKEEGVTGREDVKKQRDVVSKMEPNVPALQSKVQMYEKSTNLLEGIIQGMEQASREMLREQKRPQREQQKTKGKRKGKRRTSSWGIGE